MVARVDCVVHGPSGEETFGAFANAFRVLVESQDEVLLDFCLYSSTERAAKVVSRVRIHQNFLPLVHDRIREAVTEMGLSGEHTSGGGVILLVGSSAEG